MADTTSSGVGILEPIWRTAMALADVMGLAEVGTLLFAVLLGIAALELLRSAQGPFVMVARVLVVGAALLFAAALFYGDLLAPPARAAYSLFGMSNAQPDALLVTSLGAVSVGLAYQAGRRNALAQGAMREPARLSVDSKARDRKQLSVAAFASGLAIDAAGRIQLRQFVRNPKKTQMRVERRLIPFDAVRHQASPRITRHSQMAAAEERRAGNATPFRLRATT